jgi:2,5-furandicarboxylate decarboxylase 1
VSEQNTKPPGANLRRWIDQLHRTGRLLTAPPSLDLKYELAAVAKRLDEQRAVLFPSPSGHSIPVVAGILSRRKWIAEALGVAENELLTRFQSIVKNPIPPREVTESVAYETIHEGDAVDLLKLLPIPTHNEHDSGSYLSAGVLIMRNPVTGEQNVSINRCQVSGNNRLGVLIATRDTRQFYNVAEKAGHALEVAIITGADPFVLLASQISAPYGQNELDFAGSMSGEAIPVVKCRTNNVRVPSNAEIILEGRVLPKVREGEGPFGEFPHLYGPRGDREVIEIDLIAHRRQPIFHTVVSGSREHLLLGSVPREAVVLSRLQMIFPNVRNVHLSMGGTGRFHLYVQIQKRMEGEAKNILLASMAQHFDFKKVMVVDEDIDIFDPIDLEWAMATRFQADRDLLIVSGAQCSKLDPAAQDGFGAKLGIDATKPVAADEMRFKRTRVPGEEKVDLQRLLAMKAPSNWRAAVGLD